MRKFGTFSHSIIVPTLWSVRNTLHFCQVTLQRPVHTSHAHTAGQHHFNFNFNNSQQSTIAAVNNRSSQQALDFDGQSSNTEGYVQSDHRAKWSSPWFNHITRLLYNLMGWGWNANSNFASGQTFTTISVNIPKQWEEQSFSLDSENQ